MNSTEDNTLSYEQMKEIADGHARGRGLHLYFTRELTKVDALSTEERIVILRRFCEDFEIFPDFLFDKELD